MNSDNNKSQQLFDRLRNAPTELSREHVESIIKGLPTLPASPKAKNDWTDFLNLKNIIMISTPISIAIGLFIMNTTNEVPTQNTIAEELPKEITINTPVVEKEELPTIESEPEPVVAAPTTTFSKVEQPEVVVAPPISQPATPTVIPPVMDNPIVITDDQPKNNNDIPKKKITRKDRQGVSVAPPFIASDPVPMPKLNGLQLRKLKRILYRNLENDNLIDFKGQSVEMALLGNEIIVNGQTLNASLLLKYSELTKKVGTGIYRKVEMNDRYIKAGDFTPDGFKGSGVGTFTENFVEGDGSGLFENKEKVKTDRDFFNEIVEEEQKALTAFSERLLAVRPKNKGKKRLFGLHLSYEKSFALHQKLYNMLMADNVISSKEEFVLIELPKKMIRINGTELREPLYSKYENVFSEFKIKHGGSRQVRLSENTISAGDFSWGNFSGTRTTIE